ncbi:MAG: glycosyltransferase family 4 protein, partial [Phycisphaerales bacterium]|nr:glycosyltransferase family 4 protein [Phycisphaerales bacterium]
MGKQARILYMSGSVPVRSETFVYREILALRAIGVDVRTASVHAPVHGLDDGVLDQMAKETVEIYSSGKGKIVLDVLAELCTHPLRTIGTMMRVKLDALFSADVLFKRRAKVVWQGMAGVALARRARRVGVTHIHAHMAHVPTTIGMYAAKQLGVSFSFTGHAIDLFPNRTLLREKLERAAYVNCISYWHRRFYQSIHQRGDEDYPVVRCGVDTTRYQNTPAPGREVLEVFSVGRLVEKKGMDVLIDAARVIGERGEMKMRVRIAGGGPEGDRLAAMVADLPDGVEVELIGEIDNDT